MYSGDAARGRSAEKEGTRSWHFQNSTVTFFASGEQTSLNIREFLRTYSRTRLPNHGP